MDAWTIALNHDKWDRFNKQDNDIFHKMGEMEVYRVHAENMDKRMHEYVTSAGVKQTITNESKGLVSAPLQQSIFLALHDMFVVML